MGCVNLIVTQNVDGFHQASGSRDVVELHGSEVHAVCLNAACGKRTEMSRIFVERTAASEHQAEDLWSPELKGWGTRYPQGDDDTPLQRKVREQLAALQEKSRKKKDKDHDG